MRNTLLAAMCAGAMRWTPATQAQQNVSAEETREIAREAYIYAYPLVLEDVSIRQTTNVAEPTGVPGQGLLNQFSHSKAFPTADFKVVVRPNVDTLYSVVTLDLRPGPTVLSVPVQTGRCWTL